jgi:hypothetical protein
MEPDRRVDHEHRDVRLGSDVRARSTMRRFSSERA